MMEAIIDRLIDAVFVKENSGDTEEATGNSLADQDISNDSEMGENDQVTIRDEEENSKHLQPKLTRDGYICPVVGCIDHNHPKKRKSHVVEHIGYVHTDQLQYQFSCGKCGVGWYKPHDCYRHELACKGPGVKMPGRPLWRPPSSAPTPPPPGITLKECQVHVKRLKLKADSVIPRGPESQELVEETTEGRPPSSALTPPLGITLKECRVPVKRLKLKADSVTPRGPESQELEEETTGGRPKRIRAKPERLDCNYLV